MAAIIASHGLTYHVYADDSQLYLVIKPDQDLTVITSQIEKCVFDIQLWMNRNMLKLNESKTEIIFFNSRHRQPTSASFRFGESVIVPVTRVKNLGVYFDSLLSMEAQVLSVEKACYYHIRNLHRVRRYLSEDVSKSLVNASVTSRLDYGNSLLSGLPQRTTSRLQRVQNSAARLITRVPRRTHITPILPLRIQFKVILMTYKALNGHAPPYLTDLIQINIPRRQLRSSTKSKLVIPKMHTKTYGDRCFSGAAPALWNDIPDSIKQASSIQSFKKLLKTHLFKSHYEDI